jgi:hypothetical protein
VVSSARFVDSLAKALPSRVSRRGFLTKSAVVGSALAAAPATYALKPMSAYAAVCNCQGSSCQCGSLCCDGYTEFCCTITGNNICPPNTFMAGWWKADGTAFCGGPRYYMDCNAPCGGCGCGGSGLCSGGCSGTGCGCANGDCNNRAAGCNLFRYGQCHQEIPCLGPIVCRVVTCVPPWAIEPTCTTTARVDEATGPHDRPCLHAVVGSLDNAIEDPGGLRIQGWALDFDTQDSVTVQCLINNQVVGQAVANASRPDIASAYPGYGSAHGFDFVVSAPHQPYGLSVYALNAGYGSTNTLLGSRQITPHLPLGNLEHVTGGGGAVRVQGWAFDPDTNGPIQVQVVVDGGAPVTKYANLSRPDVDQAYPNAGPQTGFDISVPASQGTHHVCVNAVNSGPGSGVVSLGCQDIGVDLPFGSLDTTGPAFPGLRVAGWAIDPDNAGPCQVQITVDGVALSTVTADQPRPDVAAAFPSAGPNHGFQATVPVTPGTRKVCASVVKAGVAPTVFSCHTVQVPTDNPFGSVDVWQGHLGGVRVAGWVTDPDSTNAVQVAIAIDGTVATTVTANLPRPDVTAAFPGFGPLVGFDTVVPATGGAHQVTVIGRNIGAGADAVIGSATVTVPAGAPFGALDRVVAGFGGVQVSGWAADPDTGGPIEVRVYADGTYAGSLTANVSRPDVAAAYPDWGPLHGFDGFIALGPGSHDVCAYGINTAGSGGNTTLGCATAYVPTGPPVGSLDVVTGQAGGARVAGWAIDPDTSGPIDVHIYADGAIVAVVTANQSRPDVAAGHPGFGPNHGFDTVVALPAGTHSVCAYAINAGAPATNPQLGCKTVKVS